MKEFQCKNCGRRFETSDAMKQHMADAHKHPVEQKQKKRSAKSFLIYAVFGLIIVGIVYGVYSLTASSKGHIGPIGSTHTHQDVKMYVNGVKIDFALPKYQLRAQYTHFEGGDGDVNHKHATGVTIGDMLSSLGIELTRDCIKMDGNQYCNSGDKTVKVYVNGQINNQWENYDMKDLDKILISYGNENSEQLKVQLDSIASEAAKESGVEMPLVK